MADDVASADDEREIELSSITAIFPELVLSSENRFTASINLPVIPATPFTVRSPGLPDRVLPSIVPSTAQSHKPLTETNSLNAESAIEDGGDVHLLMHLPPLQLRISLPDGYPSEKPPEFKLSVSPQWISSDVLNQLLQDGERLWEEFGHDQVVFAYIDHLQQAAERGFDVGEGEGDGEGEERVLEIKQEMKIALLDFDKQAKKEKFDKETFNCGVCLGSFGRCLGANWKLTLSRAKKRIGLLSNAPLFPCLLP
jgi:E3 ubiquitin-protein ligase RNF14